VTIARIISGGQTGVDIAALRAAKSRNIPTGGTMPKGFRTLNGPKPEWAREFGLQEHASASYPPRTYQNVRDADVTIRIAFDFDSAGERCTAKAIAQYGKPSADIRLRRGRGGLIADEEDIFEAASCICEASHKLYRNARVNIAGNSERTAPGIEAFAEGLVMMLIDAVDEYDAELQAE